MAVKGVRVVLWTGTMLLVLALAVTVEARLFGLDRGCGQFDHEQHQTELAEDCSDCHHTVAEGLAPAACSSAGCHDELRGGVGGEARPAMIHAVDSSYSCLGCHTARESGPRDCGDCHRNPKGPKHRRQ
ncbi:MAG: cytochrome c3 family protein [Proteobacteria bacterium]|nr:cytochrome c3 family protein [Pseudomonadota bacterium]